MSVRIPPFLANALGSLMAVSHTVINAILRRAEFSSSACARIVASNSGDCVICVRARCQVVVSSVGGLRRERVRCSNWSGESGGGGGGGCLSIIL